MPTLHIKNTETVHIIYMHAVKILYHFQPFIYTVNITYLHTINILYHFEPFIYTLIITYLNTLNILTTSSLSTT